MLKKDLRFSASCFSGNALAGSGNLFPYQTLTFAERNYYFPIGLGRRTNNPDLVENPGYYKFFC